MPRAFRLLRLVRARPDAWLLAGVIATAAVGSVACTLRRCNNLLIFRASVGKLLEGRDLYALDPAQHLDFYKYSPTFPLLFAPLAALPFWAMTLLWNVANGLALIAAVRLALPGRRLVGARFIACVGYVLTVDGSENNALIAALVLAAFLALERGRQLAAAGSIALGTFVKLFPLAAVVLAVPHPRRGRFALLLAAALLTLALLPLLVTPPETLAEQYASWRRLTAFDALVQGSSVMFYLVNWLGYEGPNWPVQLVAAGLVAAPLLRRGAWEDAAFRRRVLASVLLYMVLFNHRAEGPSFVLATTALAVWYALSPRSTRRTLLVAACLTALVPVFVATVAPGWLWSHSAGPATAAVLPFAFLWLVVQAELHGVRLAPLDAEPEAA
jgi:hypothetical protein